MNLYKIIGKEIISVTQDHRKTALSFRCKDGAVLTFECADNSTCNQLSPLKNCTVLHNCFIEDITCEDYGWRECKEGFEYARRYLIHTKKGAAEFSNYNITKQQFSPSWVTCNTELSYQDITIWNKWENPPKKLSDRFLGLKFFLKKLFLYNTI